jgi:hypothetical protein
MSKSQVTSKMKYHAALAYEAWSNGNIADYAIEHARFELALKTLARMDRALAHIVAAVEMEELSWI